MLQLSRRQSSHIITSGRRGQAHGVAFNGQRNHPSARLGPDLQSWPCSATFSGCMRLFSFLSGTDSVTEIATLSGETVFVPTHLHPPTSKSPRHLLVPPVCECVLSGNQHSPCQQACRPDFDVCVCVCVALLDHRSEQHLLTWLRVLVPSGLWLVGLAGHVTGMRLARRLPDAVVCLSKHVPPCVFSPKL